MYKLLTVITLALGLTACSSGKIINEYDEFNDRQRCRLASREIRSETGILTSKRATFISLEKLSNGKIKCTTRVVVQGNYTPLAGSGKVNFTLTKHDKSKDNMTFKTYGYRYGKTVNTLYLHGIRIDLPISKSLFNFNISKEQLQNIVSAKKVRFIFDAGKKPIKGSFSGSDIKQINSFLEQCVNV